VVGVAVAGVEYADGGSFVDYSSSPTHLSDLKVFDNNDGQGHH